MTPELDRQRRPRTWDELRWRVLEQNYLATSELQHRKRRASQTKYAIWVAPLVLVLLVPVVIAERVSLPMALASLLIFSGAIALYLLGVRWERRWEELIRQKSVRGDQE